MTTGLVIIGVMAILIWADAAGSGRRRKPKGAMEGLSSIAHRIRRIVHRVPSSQHMYSEHDT